MGRSLLLLTSCAAMVACKPLARAPVMDLHAVTDGRLTLGVVPSATNDGMEAYRLLLCKKTAVYSEQAFNDPHVCRSALLDDNGQEVVFLHNELRRSFATKYSGHVAAGAGLLLAAFGIRAGVKFARHGSKQLDDAVLGAKKIKELAEQGDDLTRQLDMKREQMTELIASARSARAADNATSKTAKLELSRLEEELNTAFESADDRQINEVLAKISTVDAALEKRLRRIIGPENRVDAEFLRQLATRVDSVDKAFADNLRVLAAEGRFNLKRTGLAFYRENNNLFRGHYEELAKKLENFPRRRIVLPGIFDKGALASDLGMLARSKQETGEILQHAERLYRLEEQKRWLYKFNEGKFLTIPSSKEAEKIAKLELAAKNRRLLDGVQEYHGLADDATFSAKFSKIEELYKKLTIVDFTRSFSEIKRATAIEKAYFDNLPHFQNIELRKENLKLRRSMNEGSSSFDAHLTKLDREISAARKALFEAEAARKYSAQQIHNLQEKETFWRRMTSINKTHAMSRLKKERINALRAEIDAFDQKVTRQEKEIRSRRENISNIENTMSTASQRFDEAKQAMSSHRDEMKALKEALNNVEQGRSEEAARITADFMRTKKRLGLSTLSSGVGVGAAIALNQAVWSQGEKQLGSLWNQIFNTSGEFADATPVNDLPTIVRSLAEIFGHRVNSAALSM